MYGYMSELGLDDLVYDDNYALLPEEVLPKMHHYDTTMPTGPSPGRIWLWQNPPPGSKKPGILCVRWVDEKFVYAREVLIV